MSCQSECGCEPNFACLLCEEFFCSKHGEEHQSKSEHIIEIYDENTKLRIIQNQFSKALESEKYKQINQISLSTKFMISKLEESSQMRIKSVKEATSILDLKVNNFGFQNHLHYLAQVGLINKGIYFISDDQVVELNSDFNQKITEIEELKSFINNFEIRGDKIEPETKQKLAGFDEFRDRINILEAEKESITEKFEKIEKNLNQKEKDFEELCYKHKDIDFIRKVLIDLEAEAKRIEEEERIYKEKRMDQEIKKVLKGTIKKFIIKCYCKIR